LEKHCIIVKPKPIKMNQKLNLKQWSEEDRPREKLLNKGADALSKSELIAIMIGSGSRTKTAVELAQEILSQCDNDLQRLSLLGIQELCKFKGIGEAKAISIVAGLELAKRKLIESSKTLVKVSSSIQAYNYIKPYYMDLLHEEFYVMYLDRANQIRGFEKLSSGGRSGTVVDGKILFKNALKENACALILSHNHPSGQITPSKSDIDLTNRLFEFGKMIDLPILDHLIIGEDKYFSFADEGMMP
jgi:DNA repair protein RadC